MTDTATSQLVVFSLRGEHYALSINVVSEIIRYTPPRRVDSEQHGVQGVIGLRGKIIPIIDLAATLPTRPAAAPGKIVIVETSTGHLGVIVDTVDEVRSVTPEQLEAIPTTGGTIAKLDDRLVVLLEPEQLAPSGEPSAA